MTRGWLRRWMVRGVLLSGLLLGVAGAWTILYWSQLQAWYTAYQLRCSREESARQRAAERLLGLGAAGRQQAVEHLICGDAAVREALLEVWRRRAAQCPAEEVQQWLTTVQTAWEKADAAGQETVVAWLIPLLRRSDGAGLEGCKELLRSALNSVHAPVRRAAAVWAVHPALQLRQEWLGLLRDSEAEVRQAALFAIAALDNSASWLADEELFHWLHDPDEGVRRICHDLLVNRGRSILEIDLGRRLTHPEPSERLKLLAELRYDDIVADPEPWLHHLARDPEAAVRVAAVRAVAELRAQRRLLCPPWVEAVTNADPDATARRIMRYYLDLALRTTGEGLRPVGGPLRP